MEFAEYFNKAKFADVEFIFPENNNLYAHKIILSKRNKVFANMFNVKLSEKNAKSIKMTECDYNAFKYIIKYLYTQKYVNPTANIDIQSLLYVVTMYNMENLANKLDIYISNEYPPVNVTSKDIVSFIHLAELYDMPNLRTHIEDHINNFTIEVFKLWSCDDVLEFLESDCSNALPNEVLCEYINHHKKNDHALIKLLNPKNLNRLPIEFLINELIGFCPDRQLLCAIKTKYISNKPVLIGSVTGYLKSHNVLYLHLHQKLSHSDEYLIIGSYRYKIQYQHLNKSDISLYVRQFNEFNDTVQEFNDGNSNVYKIKLKVI